jgi:hypothetical protein
LLQDVDGELLDGLQHDETGLAGGVGSGLQQVRLDQGIETGEGPEGIGDRLVPDDGRGGVDRDSAAEDGQTTESTLVFFVE